MPDAKISVAELEKAERVDDARLIVASRNALPALLRVLRAARDVECNRLIGVDEINFSADEFSQVKEFCDALAAFDFEVKEAIFVCGFPEEEADETRNSLTVERLREILLLAQSLGMPEPRCERCHARPVERYVILDDRAEHLCAACFEAGHG